MSSPILRGKNHDPALMYAPPWARDQAQPAAGRPHRSVEPSQRGRTIGEKPTFSGDRAVLALQRQLLLDSGSVPEPPRSNDDDQSLSRNALRACGVAVLAAAIAWAIVLLIPGARPRGDGTGALNSTAPQTSIKLEKQDALRAATTTQPALPDRKIDGDEARVPLDASTLPDATIPVRTLRVTSQQAAPAAHPTPGNVTSQEERAPLATPRAAMINNRMPPVIQQAKPLQQDEPAAPPTPSIVVRHGEGNSLNVSAAADPAIAEAAPPVKLQQAAPPAPPALGLTIRRLDRDEVTSLIKRGEDFISSGDIASARLVLRRAAEAGDVQAALVLAGTFDPNLLEKLGMPALADTARARLWYERAEQFGSAEARRQLQQLATEASSAP